MRSVGRAAAAEFVASFALIVVGAGAVIAQANGRLDLTGVALANGLIFAAMVSVTAHLSGGVVNPAVAIGLWVAGRLGTLRAAVFVAAEVLGAVTGAFCLKFLLPSAAFPPGGGGTALAVGVAPGRGLLMEAVATFLLVFAVFGTLVDDRARLHSTAGLTIGLVVAVDIMTFGPWTGAALNPARWFGPALATGSWADWWVWLIGPAAGGVMAALVYRALFLGEPQPASTDGTS
ncbi:MAG: aquaporin [Actinomycetota bacterium]